MIYSTQSQALSSWQMPWTWTSGLNYMKIMPHDGKYCINELMVCKYMIGVRKFKFSNPFSSINISIHYTFIYIYIYIYLTTFLRLGTNSNFENSNINKLCKNFEGTFLRETLSCLLWATTPRPKPKRIRVLAMSHANGWNRIITSRETVEKFYYF